MIKNIKTITINEKEYTIGLTIKNMMMIEKISGKNFMQLMKETETGSITPIAFLLAGCVEYKKVPVGVDFIGELNYEQLNELITPMMEVIVGAMPNGDSGKK